MQIAPALASKLTETAEIPMKHAGENFLILRIGLHS
jgi:hypothetical protein